MQLGNLHCLDHLPNPEIEPHALIIAMDPDTNEFMLLEKAYSHYVTGDPRKHGYAVWTITGWSDALEEEKVGVLQWH